MENLASTGIPSPDRPARSESLYRLSYPSPRKYTVQFLNRKLSLLQKWLGIFIEEQKSIQCLCLLPDEHNYVDIVQGDSLARGPELFSIKKLCQSING